MHIGAIYMQRMSTTVLTIPVINSKFEASPITGISVNLHQPTFHIAFSTPKDPSILSVSVRLSVYSLYKYVSDTYMRGPWLLTFVHIERYGADSNPDHALGMVEELNGLGVEGKIISVLCVGDRGQR